MTLALVPLSMSTIGQLPEPCRHCAFWEIGPDGAALLADRSAAAFEKEVWLSGVSLTWGTAGLLVTADDRPVGYAIFAPPTTVPGAAAMPSGPVSPDAVLLTAARIEAGYVGRGVGRFLLDGVVAALSGRGVRAVEVFGDEGPPERGPGPDAPAAPSPRNRRAERRRAGDARPALRPEADQREPDQREPEQREPEQREPEQREPEQREPEQLDPDRPDPGRRGPYRRDPGQWEPEGQAGWDPDAGDPGMRLLSAEEHWAGTAGRVPCVLPAGFLRAVGFTEVQPHHRLPRLRYELSGEHRWQAEVEAALDRLFSAAPARSAVVSEVALVGACNSSGTPSSR